MRKGVKKGLTLLLVGTVSGMMMGMLIGYAGTSIYSLVQAETKTCPTCEVCPKATPCTSVADSTEEQDDGDEEVDEWCLICDQMDMLLLTRHGVWIYRCGYCDRLDADMGDEGGVSLLLPPN